MERTRINEYDWGTRCASLSVRQWVVKHVFRLPFFPFFYPGAASEVDFLPPVAAKKEAEHTDNLLFRLLVTSE